MEVLKFLVQNWFVQGKFLKALCSRFFLFSEVILKFQCFRILMLKLFCLFRSYIFESGAKIAVFTWFGCQLRLTGKNEAAYVSKVI